MKNTNASNIPAEGKTSPLPPSVKDSKEKGLADASTLTMRELPPVLDERPRNVRARLRTGEPILDDAVMQYRRLGNIDVFNNIMMFAYNPSTWRECGSPQEINDEMYGTSPLYAVFNKIGRDRDAQRGLS